MTSAADTLKLYCPARISLRTFVCCSRKTNHKGKCRQMLSLDNGKNKLVIEWTIKSAKVPPNEGKKKP